MSGAQGSGHVLGGVKICDGHGKVMLSRQQDVLRTRSTLFLSESVGTGKVFQPRVLEERIDGFLSRLQIDRHFIQCENFIVSLVHIRKLTWCRMAKSSKVWPNLPSTQPELA